MTEFISKYIDLLALTASFLIPVFITIRLKQRADRQLRAIPLYLLMFGPSGILAFIFCHLFENTWRAVAAVISGSFHYDFRFYSLILLGVVVASLGVKLYSACRAKCLHESYPNKQYFVAVLLVLLFTTPLIPIITIALVPLICCGISLAGFPFVRRKNETELATNKKPVIRTTKPDDSITVES